MKEVFSAINDRIKTPYYGYALLAFFALNWRAIFVLFVSKGSASERLAAFDSKTSTIELIFLPLFIGLCISLLNPWLKVLFSWIEKKPRQLYADRISDEEHYKLKYQIKLKTERDALEKVEEEKLISRAKRDSEVETIENESVKEKLKSDIKDIRKDSSDSKSDVYSSLTSPELKLMKIFMEQNTGTSYDDDKHIKIGTKTIGTGVNGEEEYAVIKGALNSLYLKNLMHIDYSHHPVKHALNGDGWALIDLLRSEEKAKSF